MGIEEDIRREKERQAAEKREREFAKELEKNGFWQGDDMLKYDASQIPEYKAVVDEALPSLIFSTPMILRILSNGRMYARPARDDEIPDTYAFYIKQKSGYYSTLNARICVFNNGFAMMDIKEDSSYKSELDSAKQLIVQKIIALREKGAQSVTDKSWVEKTGFKKIHEPYRQSKDDEIKKRKREQERDELKKTFTIKVNRAWTVKYSFAWAMYILVFGFTPAIAFVSINGGKLNFFAVLLITTIISAAAGWLNYADAVYNGELMTGTAVGSGGLALLGTLFIGSLAEGGYLSYLFSIVVIIVTIIISRFTGRKSDRIEREIQKKLDSRFGEH